MSTTTETEASTPSGGGNTTRVVILVVFGILFGLLGARFLLAGGGEGDLPPVPPAGANADERLDRLREDVSRDPENLPAWQEIASLSITQAAITGDPSYYPQAEEALDRVDELAAEGDVVGDVLRANLQLALHEFGDARQTAQDVLDTQPGNIGGLTALVDAQVELGRYDAAAETAQQLLDRRPSLPALARASYLRELNGDLDGATQAMAQAVQAGAGLSDALANVTALLGDLQLRRGDLAGAQDAYEQALAAREGFAPALTGQARLMARQGDVDGAIEQLQAVSDRTPYPGALTLLAELQAFAGDRQAAEDTGEVLRAVTQLQQEAGQVVDLELADYEAAAGSAERAFQLAQDTYASRPSIFASSALAWSLYRLDETGEAERYARESLELGSLDPVLNYRAAQVLADAGDTETATEALRRAVQHDPSGTFRHREDIAELAEELGVELPPAWQEATAETDS